MPNGKGWIEESNKFLTAMTIIQSQMSKIEQEAMDKAKRKR